MATKKLILVTSGQAGGAATALDLATEMRRQGQEADVCLLQDGVLCALQDNETPAGTALGRALEAEVGVYYLEDDLMARGFGRDDVRAEARPVGYGDLVELMLADERVPLGAF